MEIRRDLGNLESNLTQSKIFVMESNPILAESLASILVSSQHLSTYSICVQPTSKYNELKCKTSDILIIDPTQVLQGSQLSQGFFQDRAKVTSLIGYCPTISNGDLNFFKKDGFRAILPKFVPGEELVRIVCAVAFGGEYFHDPYCETDVIANDCAAVVDLSDRELAVLQHLAMGVPMKQIAAILEISPKTVDTYKNRASQKLKLTSRADIVQFAIKSGWMN